MLKVYGHEVYGHDAFKSDFYTTCLGDNWPIRVADALPGYRYEDTILILHGIFVPKSLLGA